MSVKFAGSIATVGYSITQAQCYGTKPVIESYFAGISIFSMLISLSQSGQLAEMFVPEYHRIKSEHGLGAAERAFSVVLNWLMVPTLIFSLASFIFAAPVIDLAFPGFDTSQKANAVMVFRATCLLLNIEIAAALMKTVLNAEADYGRPEQIGIGISIAGIAILLLTSKVFGIWALVGVFVLGKICLITFLSLFLKRKNVKYKLTFSDPRFDSVAFFRNALATIGYVSCTQIYSITLNALLSKAPQGTYAIFGYVQNVYGRLRGTVFTPLITVFFTHFSSSLHSSEKPEEANNSARTAMAFCLSASLTIWILITFFGEFSFKLLWGSKNFSDESIYFAWTIMVVNGIALAIDSIGSIYRKITISIGKASAAYSCWSVAQLTTAVIVYLLFANYGRDAARFIFLVNSALLATCSWSLVYTNRPSLSSLINFAEITRISIVFIALMPIAWLISFGQTIPTVSNSRIIGLLFVSGSSTVIISIFFGFASICGVKGTRELLARVRHKFKRTSKLRPIN
ncbi:hypothetical protein N9066_00315 [bacterium]|nr:hypothetical protein [bacterium]